MILDLQGDSDSCVRVADVCILGAGAAGIALAVELNRSGIDVVLLEAGGRHFESRTQDLYVGESAGLPQTGLYNGRCRVLGGTTTRWGGQVLEIDEHVFGVRPAVPGSGWPFPKQELTQAYARAAQLEGLAGAEGDTTQIWRQLRLAPPDLAPDLESAFSRWCPVTDFARLYRQELRRPDGLRVFLHANAIRLQLAADQQTLVSVQARTLSGKQVDFRARFFVLAMGGIETCRLLLHPTAVEGTAPWDARGLVGRHYQDHISCFVATLKQGSLDAGRYFDYVFLDGRKYHPKIKLRPDYQTRLGTLDVCATMALTSDGVDDVAMAYETLRFWQARQLRSLTPRRVSHFVLNAHKLLWHRIPYARRAAAASLHPPVLRLSVHCEQEPLSAGSITLGTERDSTGMLRPRVRWCTSALELHSIRSFLKVIRESFASRGLGRIVADPGIEEDDGTLTSAFRESFHHIGGTRMAGNPSEGVVDPDLRIFGTSNAYVCSTSVFPSAGFANPTHTLVALAVRLARHLKLRAAA
jgi:choline dehydrogenase-like flavoprotein